MKKMLVLWCLYVFALRAMEPEDRRVRFAVVEQVKDVNMREVFLVREALREYALQKIPECDRHLWPNAISILESGIKYGIIFLDDTESALVKFKCKYYGFEYLSNKYVYSDKEVDTTEFTKELERMHRAIRTRLRIHPETCEYLAFMRDGDGGYVGSFLYRDYVRRTIQRKNKQDYIITETDFSITFDSHIQVLEDYDQTTSLDPQGPVEDSIVLQ